MDEELKTSKAFSLSDSLHISNYTISHCCSSPPTAQPFIRSVDKHPVVMALGVKKADTKSFIWTAGINILSSFQVTYSSVYRQAHIHSITKKQSKIPTMLWDPLACLHLFISTSLCLSLTHKNMLPWTAPSTHPRSDTLSGLDWLTEQDPSYLLCCHHSMSHAPTSLCTFVSKCCVTSEESET